MGKSENRKIMAVHLCIVFVSCRLRKDCWGGMIGLLLAFPFPMFQCSMFHFGGGLVSCGPGRSLWRMMSSALDDTGISDFRVIWDGGWWAGRRRSAFPISFFPFHCSLFPTGSLRCDLLLSGITNLQYEAWSQHRLHAHLLHIPGAAGLVTCWHPGAVRTRTLS